MLAAPATWLLSCTTKTVSQRGTTNSGHITEAVDVWALGCILVEVFGGRPPFPDCTSMEHIAYVLLVKKEIPKIPDKFPSGLKSLLKKCLVLDPEKRVGMDAVICDLQRVDIR